MEVYAEVKARFSDDTLCERAIEFLNHEGPEEEADVELALRPMYNALQEAMPMPREADAIGDGWLRVSFDILGEYAADGGDEFLELWGQVGAHHVYVLLSEDYEAFWMIENGRSKRLLDSDVLPDWYDANEWDRLLGVHDGDELEVFIDMYERVRPTSA